MRKKQRYLYTRRHYKVCQETTFFNAAIRWHGPKMPSSTTDIAGPTEGIDSKSTRC